VYRHEQTGEYSTLYFKVVNKGRRPIVLTLIEGIYENDHKSGEYIGYGDGGIKLEEGDFYENRFGKYDGIMVCDPYDSGDYSDLVDLFIVDSVGNRRKIRDAKKNIKKLRSSKHPFGRR
jgi:hypothetical protein